MIVVDAAFVVDLILEKPEIVALGPLLFQKKSLLFAPELLDLEVANVLRRLVIRQAVSPERADRAIDYYADMAIDLRSHRMLLPRVWQLRHNLSGYDAAYVALAEHLSAPLWTRDQRLAKAPGLRAEVQVF